jgi:hypothetical protein
MSLALFLCLLFGQTGLGQEGRREAPRERSKPADLTGVQRRLADVQKQLMLLIKEVEALRQEAKALADAPAARLQVDIYTLRNADASEVAKTLQALFRTEEEEKKISIALYRSNNSLIVRACRNDLDTIEAIIARLDDSPKGGKKARADDKR